MLLLHLRFMATTFVGLKSKIIHGTAHNMMNYVSWRAHMFNFGSIVRNAAPNTLTGQEEVKKLLKKLFDKSDLLPDA